MKKKTQQQQSQSAAKLLVCSLLAVTGSVQAQDQTPRADADTSWQRCQRLADDKEARLDCFDRWARQQQSPSTATTATQPPAPPVPPVDGFIPATRVVEVSGHACRDHQYSTLSRFWELEDGSDCGTFGLRGYRPIDVTFAMATDRPQTPTSPAPNHTGTLMDYQPGEMRLTLSLRTKLAQGMLTSADSTRKDSLWFGYTQKSTWQVFNAELSRPFRTTDHEPELMYVYPVDKHLPGGWRWRYAGAGLVHQSNGQADPLSRSWNRFYLMGGVELDNRLVLTARVWKRIREAPEKNDNPDISSHIGRAEFSGWWYPDSDNAIGLIVRAFGKGSQRLEYTRAIGDSAKSNLRFVMQIFNGYGDTLVDYNRKRTVFSVGLRLVDF